MSLPFSSYSMILKKRRYCSVDAIAEQGADVCQTLHHKHKSAFGARKKRKKKSLQRSEHLVLRDTVHVFFMSLSLTELCV